MNAPQTSGCNLDGAPFDENGLERLNAERRCSVGARFKKHGMLFDNAFQHVPNGRLCLFRLKRFALLILWHWPLSTSFVHDERLEQLDRHFFGETALIEFEFGPDDDNRTAGIVDALAEKVLTETPLLAAQKPGTGI